MTPKDTLFTSELLALAATTRFPSPTSSKKRFSSDEARAAFIADRFREIMEALDLNLNDPSLAQTPQRVADMYVYELCAGLDVNNFPEVTSFELSSCEETQVVHVRQIPISTLCEHHFLPIVGTAEVAYRPKGRVLGLSKINRIVHYFCQRPQLQERLTAQIADSLSLLLDIEDIAVRIDAKHGCVCSRGVQDAQSTTRTTLLRGEFQRVSPFD